MGWIIQDSPVNSAAVETTREKLEGVARVDNLIVIMDMNVVLKYGVD